MIEQHDPHQLIIARQLQLSAGQVAATAKLLAEGATIPFVARYRKEMTGMLDELQIAAIRDQLARLAELDKRRQAISASLAERELLTDELQAAVQSAASLAVLEDIYLPYRPKRRTRSMIAREKGLEPLALAIFSGKGAPTPPQDFVSEEKGVLSADDALAGARDIIAEWISEEAKLRARLRTLFAEKAVITSLVVKKNQESGVKFRDYFDWQAPAAKTPGHRLLAMFRGENEKVLTLSLRPPEKDVLPMLQRLFVRKNDFCGQQVGLAVEDSYKRLLAPSLENELRGNLKERADKEAIQVFADNLRQLLLAPPLGQKRIMALDPGFRTGAKLVCLDGQGKLLDFTAIYPTHSERKQEEAGRVVMDLCRKYAIEAIAVGNGTAGRETESFVRGLGLPAGMIITMVDESGASVYSASEAARSEFPDHDVTVRGAVSIGRRLQDPLAELVKIDAKAIGVGQYQHDVNQSELKKGLEDMVVSCVNSVGVEVNTASMELLTFVSGLGPALAKNIIAFRNEHGPFIARQQLLKVPRLGAKAFEQCAGFLRVHGAKNPLDASGVHPERYAVVQQMARDAGCSVAELIEQEARRKGIDIARYVSDGVGLPTLTDIMAELAKPGRDPRRTFSLFSFTEGISTIDDLQPGMKLPGIVTNVTKFGAFVDLGVHQEGLIHISQLADRFVRDPAEVVKVRQQVTVRVVEVDRQRKRIALSLRDV
ncbi:MAG: RNA-binding transcriptional accessory protein [Proteobacteria bacterium]|nr:RNA-binding transcriptional accessory protein [Pseudomonadota bacterium]MBU4296328.1 RNA-binding transcriptional accessory protein [Pseudomonadota bacterium]MCG2746572.1 RNA-binding transcriptional accessory protein [Desulfobulbaceae bacterium]